MLAKGQQELIGCSVVPGTENYFGTKLWSDYDFLNPPSNKAAAALKQYGYKEILPILNFTPQEQDRLNVLQADINTYIKSMQTKFIMGAEPLSNWDNYVSTIKKMGLDELMKIFQAAYDRYNKSK